MRSEMKTGTRTVHFSFGGSLIHWSKATWTPLRETQFSTGDKVWVGDRTDGNLAVKRSGTHRDCEIWVRS